MNSPPRLSLAQLPTPLERADRLTEAWGGPTIWVKRDDLTGFGLSGSKIRKLEYHLAAAREADADTVVTCGAAQSNHCRATALAAARLGLRCVLYLRTPDGAPPQNPSGNYLLQRLAGAECRFITPDEYGDRDALMQAAAAEMDAAWVIPEGASDALGSWGFVGAIEELGPQLEAAGIRSPILWHAASSAGTTAGMVRGAGAAGLSARIVGSSVGDAARDLEHHVRSILDSATERYGRVSSDPEWRITDAYVGDGYGVVSDVELAAQVEATRLTGLIFDPTYTGKAIYGLREEIRNGSFGPDDDVVFWHTGGGFAAFAHDWRAALTPG
jgi:D-cysteine desulfhydrase